MSTAELDSPPAAAPPPQLGLFREYEVGLRARSGNQAEALTLVVRARTQGAARRSAARDNPGHVVISIVRVH